MVDRLPTTAARADCQDQSSRADLSVNGGDALFVALLALISTLFSYRFGSGNQVEQIPIILRQLDPGYLVNDFFVTSSTEFGPRLYYAKALAWIAQFIPLSWTYLGLTFLTDMSLVVVTQWAARRIVGTGRLGAAIASVMVLGLTSFHLGEATQIRYEVFQPASLAIPGALWAVGLGLLGRPIAAAIVAALSSLPHPLYGAEGGAVALATAFIALLVAPSGGNPPPGQGLRHWRAWAWRDALLRTAAGAAILGIFLALFWWWPYRNINLGAGLSNSEFFDILARFRAPHHYLPGQFPLQDYVAAALFLAVAAFGFERWMRSVSPGRAFLFMVPAFIAILGCVAGTVFSEIWPLRAVLTLQPFRLLSILKWEGFLLLGWLFACYWRSSPVAFARHYTVMSLLSGGVTHPAVSFAVLSLIRFHRKFNVFLPDFLVAAGMAIVTGVLWLVFGKFDEQVYLLVAFGFTALFVSRWRNLAVVLVLGISLWVVIADPDELAVAPVFTLSSQQDIAARTARAAAQVTPSDALLVTPPQFGLLRIQGQRALVVDFKSIPFQDVEMLEWRERMRVVYGEVEEGGFKAARAFDKAYRQISDAHLLELAGLYGATHALLYLDTPTQLPEIYANDSYRIVELD